MPLCEPHHQHQHHDLMVNTQLSPTANADYSGGGDQLDFTQTSCSPADDHDDDTRTGGGADSPSSRVQNESLDKEGKTCPLCHMQFKRRTGLDRHTLKHYCRICGELFCQGQQREAHHSEHHEGQPLVRDDEDKAPIKNFGKLKCPECRRTYNYIKQLEKHRAMVHNRYEVIRRYVHTCREPSCGKSFVSKEAKNKHQLIAHGISSDAAQHSPSARDGGNTPQTFATTACGGNSHAATPTTATCGAGGGLSSSPHGGAHVDMQQRHPSCDAPRSTSPLSHQMVNPELSTPMMLGASGNTSPVGTGSVNSEVFRGQIDPVTAHSSDHMMSFHSQQRFQSGRQQQQQQQQQSRLMLPQSATGGQSQRPHHMPSSDSSSMPSAHPLAGLNAGGTPTSTVLTGTVSPTGSTSSNNSGMSADDYERLQEQMRQVAASSPSAHSPHSHQQQQHHQAMMVTSPTTSSYGGGGGNSPTGVGAAKPFCGGNAAALIQQICRHHEQQSQHHQQVAAAAKAAASSPFNMSLIQALANQNVAPTPIAGNGASQLSPELKKALLEKQQQRKQLDADIYALLQRQQECMQQQTMNMQLQQQQQQQTALLTTSVTMPVAANSVRSPQHQMQQHNMSLAQPTPRHSSDHAALAALINGLGGGAAGGGSRSSTPTVPSHAAAAAAMQQVPSDCMSPQLFHLLKNGGGGGGSPNVPMASPSPSMMSHSSPSPMDFVKHFSPQANNFHYNSSSSSPEAMASVAAAHAAFAAAQNQQHQQHSAMRFPADDATSSTLSAFNNIYTHSKQKFKPEHQFRPAPSTPLVNGVTSKPPPLKSSIGAKRSREEMSPTSSALDAFSVQKLSPSPRRDFRSGRSKILRTTAPGRGDSESVSPSRSAPRRDFDPAREGLAGGDSRPSHPISSGTMGTSPFRGDSTGNVHFRSRSRSPPTERLGVDLLSANSAYEPFGALDDRASRLLGGGGLGGALNGFGMTACAAKSSASSQRRSSSKKGAAADKQKRSKKPRLSPAVMAASSNDASNPLSLLSTTAIACGRHDPTTSGRQSSSTAPPTSSSAQQKLSVSATAAAAEKSAIAERLAQHTADAETKVIEIRIGAADAEEAKPSDGSDAAAAEACSSSSSSGAPSTSSPTQENLSSHEVISMYDKHHPLQKYLSRMRPPKSSSSSASTSASRSPSRSRSPSASPRSRPVSATSTSVTPRSDNEAPAAYADAPSAFSSGPCAASASATLSPEDLAAMRPPPPEAAPADASPAASSSGSSRINSVVSHIQRGPSSPPPSGGSGSGGNGNGNGSGGRDAENKAAKPEKDIMDIQITEAWTREQVRDFVQRRWPQLDGFANECYENFINGRMFLRFGTDDLEMMGVPDDEREGLQKDILFYMNSMDTSSEVSAL